MREEQIGDCTLYCDRWENVLPTLARVDVCLTDPPYDEKTHKGARYGFRATSNEISFPPLANYEWVPAALAVTDRWVVAFCALEQFGQYRDAAGDCWVRAGFWHRINGVPQFTGDRPGQPGEGLAIMHGPGKKRWNRGGHHAFWSFPKISSSDKEHETQKPLELMASLLNDFTDQDETILDCFAGSGTTGVACAKSKRRFIGVEANPTHFATACRRIESAYRQSDLFLPPPAAKPVQQDMAL